MPRFQCGEGKPQGIACQGAAWLDQQVMIDLTGCWHAFSFLSLLPVSHVSSFRLSNDITFSRPSLFCILICAVNTCVSGTCKSCLTFPTLYAHRRVLQSKGYLNECCRFFNNFLSNLISYLLFSYSPFCT